MEKYIPEVFKTDPSGGKKKLHGNEGERERLQQKHRQPKVDAIDE